MQPAKTSIQLAAMFRTKQLVERVRGNKTIKHYILFFIPCPFYSFTLHLRILKFFCLDLVQNVFQIRGVQRFFSAHEEALLKVV
jgi:hypothetical protein